jgi:exosortase C (VPDSG-CTERM-specific)
MKKSDTETKDTESSLPIRAVNFWRTLNSEERVQMVGFLGFAGLLIVLFGLPMISLMWHAAGTDIHSHILLIPFIFAYLLRIKLHELPKVYEPSPGWAMIPLAGGAAAYAAGWNLDNSGALSRNDSLSLTAFAFVLLIVGGGFLFAGRRWMSVAAFPMAFLAFMIPLPDGVLDALETASKIASTEVADVFFTATRTPVLRDGALFQLPGMVIEVAQECSGIRSSYVLFITSLLVSHLFLKTSWRRVVLVAFVIPLGIVRNGFRILVIGLLCIHSGPQMIDSPIHHKGGPVFFALSLIPLLLLLWWLRRGERGRSAGDEKMTNDE